MTKIDILEKAAEIRQRLNKGLIKGKLKQLRARQYIAHLKWKAKKMEQKTSVQSENISLKSFFPTMNLLRIEELVADRIYKQLMEDQAKVSTTKTTKRKSV